MTHAVSEGSLPGSFLILVYINDLSSPCKRSKIFLYADDTAIIKKNDNFF